MNVFNHANFKAGDEMKGVFRTIRLYFKKVDTPLLIACLSMSILGLVLLAGIINSGLVQSGFTTQAVALGAGLVAAFILSLFDYRFWAGLWKLYLPIAYGLVILTFFIGTERGGDKAWLVIFGFSLQPTELLKIAFIMSFALHLKKVGEHINKPNVLFQVVVHGAIPILLAHFQGDDGTAIIFAFIFVSMLFAAGLSWKYIFSAAGMAVVAAPLTWFFILTEDQRMRFKILFNPEMDPQGMAWQQLNGELAIGSGQIWGKGIFAGDHIRVPEIRNDFIFAFLGESLGFMGCLLVIVLILFICIRLLMDSAMSKDPAGKYICIGVFAMIAFQSILNIGMCLSILPVIGVTLPLLSSGGTSVLTVYLGIGLALSVHSQNRNVMFD